MSPILFNALCCYNQVFIYSSAIRIRKEELMNSNSYLPASVKKWDPQISR